MPGFIVTGATSSIGLEVCRELSKQGFTLGLVGRDETALDQLKNELGGDVHLRIFDADKELANLGSIISELCEALGDVRAVISSHGVIPLSSLRDISYQDWESVFRVNLFSNIEILKAFRKSVPRSDSTRKGIFISSVATERGTAGLASYSASKSALKSLVRSAAIEFASERILVNSIQLGLLDAGMGSRIRDRWVSSDLRI